MASRSTYKSSSSTSTNKKKAPTFKLVSDASLRELLGDIQKRFFKDVKGDFGFEVTRDKNGQGTYVFLNHLVQGHLERLGKIITEDHKRRLKGKPEQKKCRVTRRDIDNYYKLMYGAATDLEKTSRENCYENESRNAGTEITEKEYRQTRLPGLEFYSDQKVYKNSNDAITARWKAIVKRRGYVKNEKSAAYILIRYYPDVGIQHSRLLHNENSPLQRLNLSFAQDALADLSVRVWHFLGEILISTIIWLTSQPKSKDDDESTYQTPVMTIKRYHILKAMSVDPEFEDYINVPGSKAILAGGFSDKATLNFTLSKALQDSKSNKAKREVFGKVKNYDEAVPGLEIAKKAAKPSAATPSTTENPSILPPPAGPPPAGKPKRQGKPPKRHSYDD